MSSVNASVDVLVASAVADISTLVGRSLLERHLDDFIRSRDALIRLMGDCDTLHMLHRQSLRDLEDTWDSLFQNLRSELPKTLDELLNKLQKEFRQAEDSSTGSLPTAPLTPPSATTEVPRFHLTNQAPEESDATITTKPTSNNRERSATLSADLAAVEKDKSSTAAGPSSIEAGNPTLKRGLNTEGPLPIAKKKAKRTPQFNRLVAEKPLKKSISICEVKTGECIYKYGSYVGFYVLRCNVGKCKKKFRRDGPTIFTSHPFSNGLALDHFSGDEHNIKSEPEIFRKFAIRVTDAMSECNVEKKSSDIPRGSPSGRELPLPPRDKSKQPERLYNLYPPPEEAAAASVLPSTSNLQGSVRESPNQTSRLVSKRDSVTSSDDDDELPTLERALRFDSRGRKIPDYTLPPYDEFDI